MLTNNTRGLWRGKRVDNGEWVKGDLSRMGEQRFIAGKDHWKFAVDLSTLGECTGMRDKNGTLIFEGDIVDYNGTKHEVVFETRFSAYFGIKISHIETWQFCLEVPAKLMEVIGNIHDTPELLKGADKP